MEVHFTPEQEAQLAQIATKSGTPLRAWLKMPCCVCLKESLN
jgi:hypothetical protein